MVSLSNPTHALLYALLLVTGLGVGHAQWGFYGLLYGAVTMSIGVLITLMRTREENADD